MAFSKNGNMLEQYKLQNQLWITIHNNMPSMQLSQSTPKLQTKTSRIQLDNKEVKQTISSLEEELVGMFAEYLNIQPDNMSSSSLPSISKVKMNLPESSPNPNYRLSQLPLPPTSSLL